MYYLLYALLIFTTVCENSGQISIRDSNIKCMQFEFEFHNQNSNFV